jgi:hypothetical protein
MSDRDHPHRAVPRVGRHDRRRRAVAVGVPLRVCRNERRMAADRAAGRQCDGPLPERSRFHHDLASASIGEVASAGAVEAPALSNRFALVDCQPGEGGRPDRARKAGGLHSLTTGVMVGAGVLLVLYPADRRGGLADRRAEPARVRSPAAARRRRGQRRCRRRARRGGHAPDGDYTGTLKSDPAGEFIKNDNRSLVGELSARSIQNGQFISGTADGHDQTTDPGSRAALIQGYLDHSE